ncbi:putative orphan protein [Pseudoalteromonas luteoviolacea B = ATCC 29581]|nr:putative orphan protein [Pseudoalteromonas luteoviolacea B = ATCC 29581]
MGSSDKQIDNAVLSQLKQNNKLPLISSLDELGCTHSDIVILLVEYQVMTEQDDELFDAWYDSLCEDKLKVLKAFEILRAQYEQTFSE